MPKRSGTPAVANTPAAGAYTSETEGEPCNNDMDVGNSRGARKGLHAWSQQKEEHRQPEGQHQQQRQHDYNTDVNRSRDGCNSRDAHSKEVSNGNVPRRLFIPALQ